MYIGIDFDNTIVSYDALFHKVALEQNLILAESPVNKVAVRDHLRRIDQEARWTEMQGYVYGSRMDEATAYPGMLEFMRKALDKGHTLAIISHKTKHPFSGPQYDLHAAARAWIENHLVWEGEPLLPEEQIFFELTKDDKLARIAAVGCELFIDDLPEILAAPRFPKDTRPLLFDPEGHHAMPDVSAFVSWQGITKYLEL